MGYYGEWAPYVPVAVRRARALKKMKQLRKKGVDIQPIEIEGRKITKSFWGQAWCDHMESLGDFSNRLPRGRTYVRNGSVCHLAITKGLITAMVSGSDIYHIKVKIEVLPAKKWKDVKSRCAGQIGSLLELLQGRLSDEVMGVVTDSSSGIFPIQKEIRLGCDCPDGARMCKHLAAVLYGVGARLDDQPELLFLLRGVEHLELISASGEDAVTRATHRGDGNRPTLASDELGEVFGIDLEPASNGSIDSAVDKPAKRPARKRATSKKSKKKPSESRRKRLSVKKKSSKSVPKKSTAKSTKKKAAKKKSTKKLTSKKQADSSRMKKAAKKKPTKSKAVKKKTGPTVNKKSRKKPK